MSVCVCAFRFDVREARVACKQLGYVSGRQALFSVYGAGTWVMDRREDNDHTFYIYAVGFILLSSFMVAVNNYQLRGGSADRVVEPTL